MNTYGFFPKKQKESRRVSIPTVAECARCQLYKKCKSPKMPVSGKGKKKILIAGEAPGRTEDLQNRPFCGDSGELLEKTLRRLGIDMRQDCWITNAVICRPSDEKGNNRTPEEKEIAWCRPNLIQAIKDLKPEMIIPLGSVPVKSLLGWLWKEDTGGINRWVGWQIPHQKLNTWICANYHPAHILRASEDEAILLLRLFEEFMEEAASLEGRPWKETPDWRKKITLHYAPEDAIPDIESLISDRAVAWDIETNMKNPDSKEAEIVCASMSDGRKTIAFPWSTKVEDVFVRFLESDTPKIGYSSKYEERWVNRKLGVQTSNWVWDGLLATHTLDNRGGITSLKFQSFVLLGQDDYAGHIKPFLKADGSNAKNRIRELPWEDLLLYNGLDALLEWKVAHRQLKMLGRDSWF